MLKQICFLYVAIVCASPLFTPTAHADKIRAPWPYIVQTETGTAYFKMVPDSGQAVGKDAQGPNGHGAFYVVSPSEGDTVKWQVKGWYAYRVFVSRDGRYLVRLGNWPEGRAPSRRDLAVAFYDNGRLLKSYSTAELIKKPERIQATAGHYPYLGDTEPHWLADGDSIFALETADGSHYRFDAKTGKILRSAVMGKRME